MARMAILAIFGHYGDYGHGNFQYKHGIDWSLPRELSKTKSVIRPKMKKVEVRRNGENCRKKLVE